MELARAEVVVRANTGQFDSGMKSVQARLGSMAQSMTQFGRKMTTMVTLPIVAGFVGAVKAAGDMEGAMAKFNVVFQGSEQQMLDWAQAFRAEFPLAETAIIKYAAGLQDLMVPMGVVREDAMGLTQEFMHVAGALAAFNDIPIEQALEAITSAIAGQSRPMRALGADVSETALQQYALTQGLWDGKAAWDAQTRVVALAGKIYEDSADALNGLEEQKGSLLWKMQEVKAEFGDLAREIGEILLPAAKDLMDWTREMIGAFRELDPEQQEQIVKWAGIVAVAGPVIWVFGGIAGAMLKIIGLFGAMKGGLAAIAGSKGLAAVSASAWPAKTALGLLGTKMLSLVAVGGPITVLVGGLALIIDWVRKNEKAYKDMLEVAEITWDEMGNMVDAETGRQLNIIERFQRSMQGLNIEMYGNMYSTTTAEGEAIRIATAKWTGEVRALVDYEARLAAEAFAKHMASIRNQAQLMTQAVMEAFKVVEATSGRGYPATQPSAVTAPGWMDMFHTGGTFRAPRLGGEGLAVLKDRERVIPAGQDGGEGGATVINMNITQHITDKTTADYATNKLAQVFQTRGLAGAFR